MPDGNIVTSSSTGNYLRLFKLDTLKSPHDISYKTYPIIDGHNVVWDKKRSVLWAGSGNQLYAFGYNAVCGNPALILSDSFALPGNLHDLFPVYGEDALWLTTDKNVFKLGMSNKKLQSARASPSDKIKSVSSGPAGFEVIISHPKEKWWTDEVISLTGQTIFKANGLKIYKARWFLQNGFSYPEEHAMKICP